MDNKNTIIAIFLVAIMIGGMLFFLPMNNNPTTGSGSNAVSATGLYSGNVHSTPLKQSASPFSGLTRSQMAQAAISAAKSSNVPLSDVFLPNYASTTKLSNGIISLGYGQSPAPMGIGFYGLYNNSGTTAAKNYIFPNAEAQINLSSLQTLNLADGGPQSVTFQLNAVLNNVNLFGNSSYNMWTQNVVVYSARTHTATLELNIWNFSSPTAVMSSNAINYSSGVVYPYPYAYIVVGPSFQINGPGLNMNLYMNTSLVNGRQAVFFNYSLQNVLNASSGKSMNINKGSYDEAIFNSTNAAPVHYLVSGSTLNPTGFIPYDEEIMVGGPGGGSTATVMNISGTMKLLYYNTTTNSFQNVPNAYDIGSETGETSVGVDVHYTGSTAMLTSGPSMVYGLWNETNSTFSTYHVQITNASDSYVFVGQNSMAAGAGFWNWAPVNYGKNQVYYLPTSAKYPFEVLSNFHNMVGNNVTYLNLTTTTNVNLVSNVAAGIYTPIIANGNAQLSLVASSGSGTAASPYVLALGGYAQINTVFGQLNDYAFPAFPGVLVYNTNAHVNVENFNMMVSFSGVASLISNFYGLPGYNGLNMWIYNSSNVSITSSTFNSWYSFQQTGYFEGSLNLWNSTNVMVSSSTFYSWGMGAFTYNAPDVKANITFESNTFENSAAYTCTPQPGPAYATILNGESPIGLLLFSNNTSVHNNYFLTTVPVFSCDLNYYTFAFANYSGDNINHNYYWNYNETGSYNGLGYITTGVTDTNPWIIQGTNYTVDVPNIAKDASLGVSTMYFISICCTGESFTFVPAASGSALTLYDVPVLFTGSFQDFQTSELITSTLASTGSTITNQFNGYSQVLYNSSSVNQTLNLFTGSINVTDSSASGQWTPIINGMPQSTTSGFNETISNVPFGIYYVGVSSGGLTTNVQTSLMVDFTGSTPVSVSTNQLIINETGLSSGTSWSVNIGGTTLSSDTSSISVVAPQNTYTYTVSTPSGYSVSTGGSGTVYLNQTKVLAVTFTAAAYSLSFTENGLSSGTSWNVTVNGHNYSSNTTTLSVSVSYGSVTYKVDSVNGYSTTTGNNTIFVAGNSQIAVGFTQIVTPSSGMSPTETYAIGGVTLVVGLLVGLGASMFLRKKP
ncbi:MAG: thermopsin family protease [Candidatus Thermoplasmatota archaeon]|nr:thermopsin family protease [Candidatus Thermoplasmatota archaeon]